MPPSGADIDRPGAEAHATPGVLARALLAVLRGYKLFLSPLFAGSCRFTPSCADYTAEAVRLHGAVRGTGLGLRRLARCRPFGGRGFDPVPAVARLGHRHGPWRALAGTCVADAAGRRQSHMKAR